MAGIEGFPGGGGQGPAIFWDHSRNQSVPQFVEGDPRRPTTMSGRMKSSKGYTGEESGEGQADSDKYAGLGIGVTGLVAENIICHPFTILRRQCQVNVESRRYHTTPITLLPVLVNLNRWQGVAVLWKGIGSSLIIKGLNLGVEDCLSKFTPWPKEIDRHSSLKMIGQHLLLKAVATALITPFYSASLVETVQSDIASEKPGFFDVFKEGLVRLISWSDPRCGRMLPVWVLMPPQVVYCVSHYIISTIVQGVWLQVLKATHREYQKLQGAVSKDPQLSHLPGLSQYQQHAAALTGHFVAETLLYPLETVIHRLHLQGTRSIIDNLDTGREVVPILTRYEGVSDCFSTILHDEGISGLFKGFGAVLLQYSLHFLIIKFSSKIISQVAQVFYNPALDPRLVGLTEKSTGSGVVASVASGEAAATAPAPSVSNTASPKLSSRRQSPLRSIRETNSGNITRSNPQTPSLGTPVAAGLPPLFSNTSSPRRKITLEEELSTMTNNLRSGSGASKSWRSFDQL